MEKIRRKEVIFLDKFLGPLIEAGTGSYVYEGDLASWGVNEIQFEVVPSDEGAEGLLNVPVGAGVAVVYKRNVSGGRDCSSGVGIAAELSVTYDVVLKMTLNFAKGVPDDGTCGGAAKYLSFSIRAFGEKGARLRELVAKIYGDVKAWFERRAVEFESIDKSSHGGVNLYNYGFDFERSLP